MKLAIVGFRHGHVGAIYQKAQELDFVEIVACVEEDPAAREAIPRDLGVTLTHASFDEVLDSVEFDALACVDYYAKRGPLVIRALEAGKHVVTDKPLCTEIDQLQTIARLSRERDLIVHVDLTMRYSPGACTVQRLVSAGAIGELATATIFGQHPLAWGSRPHWYFEPGKHRGTLNDIMIHGLDMLRWATGREFTCVLAAAASGLADSPAPPHFQHSAQCFMELAGGARVFGDSSYLAPAGHHAPWRFFLWGSQGHLSWELGGDVELQRAGEPVDVGGLAFLGGETPTCPMADPFEDFARQVEFGAAPFLDREACLRSSMAALAAQKAADTGQRDLPVEAV